MGLAHFAFTLRAGLKAGSGTDAQLSPSQTVRIAFCVYGYVGLLAYIVSRVYLLVKVILVYHTWILESTTSHAWPPTTGQVLFRIHH